MIKDLNFKINPRYI